MASPTCPHCRRRIPVRAKGPVPVTCGFMRCRALHTWSPAEWAGQRRMAEARRMAGVPLSELDREALDRTQRSP